MNVSTGTMDRFLEKEPDRHEPHLRSSHALDVETVIVLGNLREGVAVQSILLPSTQKNFHKVGR